MPERIRRNQNGSWRVSTPGGVKAKHTTYAKAQAQARLLRGIERGWKPTGKKEAVDKLVTKVLAEAATNALAQYIQANAQYGYTTEEAAQALEGAASTLRSDLGNLGVAGGGYAYYPGNQELTKWTSSDGGEFEADLADILCGYAGPEAMDAAMEARFEDVLVKRRVDQEDYEASKL